MADIGRLNPVIRCYHCRALMRQLEAHAITAASDGTLRVWTPERAAAFVQGKQRLYTYAPIFEYLCSACYQVIFESGAQDDGEQGERPPQGKTSQEPPARPGSRR